MYNNGYPNIRCVASNGQGVTLFKYLGGGSFRPNDFVLLRETLQYVDEVFKTEEPDPCWDLYVGYCALPSWGGHTIQRVEAGWNDKTALVSEYGIRPEVSLWHNAYDWIEGDISFVNMETGRVMWHKHDKLTYGSSLGILDQLVSAMRINFHKMAIDFHWVEKEEENELA